MQPFGIKIMVIENCVTGLLYSTGFATNFGCVLGYLVKSGNKTGFPLHISSLMNLMSTFDTQN